MSKPLAVACLLLLSAGLVSAEPGPGDTRMLTDDTGIEHSIPDVDVPVTVLYFWAVWCYPCEPAGTQLQRLHEKYAERGVRILGVAYSDSDGPSAWAKEQGYGFPIVLQGYETARSYGVNRIPTILVLDPAGGELTRMIGHRPENEEQLRELVEERLRSAKESS